MLESSDLPRGTVADEKGESVRLTERGFARFRESRIAGWRADALR